MNKIIALTTIFLIVLACENSSETYGEGKVLYIKYCENCHMHDGSGLEELYPPLSKSDYLSINRDKISCIIKHGLSGEIIVNDVLFNMNMPSNESLSAVEITNILNYINNSWGNKIGFTTLKEVEKQIQKCKKKPAI